MLSSTTTNTKDQAKDAYSDDAKENVSRLKRDAQRTANSEGEDIMQTAEAAGRKVRDVFESASDKVRSTSSDINREVHSHPLQSTLIALGAGIVVGMMFRR